MSAPGISVIIPTYNRAHLLSQAIDSALGQTIGDVEVIVVDDGSTDRTPDVLRSYGNRIRWVSTPNGGIARARNIGMEHAGGRYLTFLDSDDLLYPYALELEASLLDRFTGVALVCAEVTGFDDHGFYERYHLRHYHRSSFQDPSATYDSIFGSSMPLADACRLPETLLRDDPVAGQRRAYFGNVFDTYLRRLVICQNTAMLRREVVAEVGTRNEHVYNYEEYDYLLRIARNHDVLFADVPTYKIRYHAEQISSTARHDGMLVWIRKQQVLLRVFRRHAYADRSYRKRNQERLDRHLAGLHRAAAVPMLLLGAANSAGRSYDRYLQYARVHLARCAQLGKPQHLLQAASWMPGPFRKVLVRFIEGMRKDGWRGLLDRFASVFARRLGRRTGTGRS